MKDNDEATKPSAIPSRIPLRSAGSKPLYSPSNPNSSNVLIERSANEINMTRNRPSRLSKEVKITQGNDRTVSIATNGSVVHNKLSPESAPNREGSIPEWKRRLVYGQLQYGEQKDLFCSAATGLQDMFKPPSEGDGQEDEYDAHEISMPSSPPLYQYGVDEDIDRLVGLAEEEEHDYPDQVTPSPSPRKVKRGITYTKTFEDDSALENSYSANDFYQETPIRPAVDQQQTAKDALRVPSEAQFAQRQASAYNDTENEDFSPIFIGRHNDEDGHVEFGPIEIPADELHERLEQLQHSQLEGDSPDRVSYQGNTVSRASEIAAAERFAKNGAHVNLRRGGRSTDGSFYNRALSPDLGVDTSEMLPEESLQASTPKEFPSVRTSQPSVRSQADLLRSPSLPRAPFPSPDKRQLKGNSMGVLGSSPLKLFEPYDTFTNQTLLRRISQFEEAASGRSSQLSTHAKDSLKHEVARDRIEPNVNAMRGSNPSLGARRVISKFGSTDLNDFEFTGDFSSDGANDESPSLHFMSRAPIYPLTQRHTSHGSARISLPRRREKSGQTSDGTSLPGTPHRKPSLTKSTTLPPESAMESKRPRTSPVKDPTPKRRRTLHKSDIAFGKDILKALEEVENDSRYGQSKKRQDSRPGEFQLTSPEVLAARSILQPMSPGSSRASSYGSQQSMLRHAPISAKSHMRTQGTNSGLPNDTDRKPSIRTQDFVDQAAQIMAMIRNQVKPPGMASVEESEQEHENFPETEAEQEGTSHQESTYEPFSRPPSREVKAMPRLAEQPSDPALADRLRKYREFSDMGDIISSSMRSVSLAQNAIRAAQEVERQIEKRSLSRSSGPFSVEGDIISDLPNVRISANPHTDVEYSSSGHNTNNTVPTRSSTGSDSRRTILPETISHLIPDRVGSMYLDKQQNIWIKKKEAELNELPSPASDSSDEDPFASIPDLSVDITQEMANLHRAVRPTETDVDEQQPVPRMVSAARHELEKLENRVRDSSADLNNDAANLSNELDQVQDNGQTSSRRRNLTITFSSPIASVIQDVFPEDLDSLEDDDGSFEQLAIQDCSENQSPTHAPTSRAMQNGAHSSTRGTTSGPVRYSSIRGKDFIPRPVSRIDEQDEESTVELPIAHDRQVSILGENSLVMSRKTPNNRRTSLSFVVNQASANNALALAGDESIVIGGNVGKLSLSPLSEFTLNQVDQSFGLEVSYVMGQRHLSTGDGSKRVMSMTIRDLVDRLSEVEPFEPYWEDISELDIHDKRLSSLHMLDEFCGKIVSLDASTNILGHLEGIPSCVRHLKVSNNRLTELTSWDHLMNLQYVDVSGNDIKSLSALKNLVHLRSVRADNNQITSLDGLDQHDGLLSLRVRDNLIEELDFSTLALERLADLDVSGNQIHTVCNMEDMPALSRLNLSGNQLQVLELDSDMTTLRYLDLSDNDFDVLDVSKLPNLHTLHADRNQISHIAGLQLARRLDSLSLREQRGEEALDTSFLTSGYEIRKLYLSGNLLGSFQVKVDMLNLQLLDLANCGLDKLPKNLGQLTPNLRTININFNAISDLSALRYVPRLKKLLVAGNRLADSTSVTELLTDFPHLTRLDVRDNPMTLGFYAPCQALVSTNGEDNGDRFTLPDTDPERDATYASRLDETTKLRRRLHQVVLTASCKRLRVLDGLAIERKDMLAIDTVLQSLIDDGLLPDIGQLSKSSRSKISRTPEEQGASKAQQNSNNAKEEEDKEGEAEQPQSSRWRAEDSFA